MLPKSKIIWDLKFGTWIWDLALKKKIWNLEFGIWYIRLNLGFGKYLEFGTSVYSNLGFGFWDLNLGDIYNYYHYFWILIEIFFYFLLNLNL
jgi:hypothetical protein